jgi:hypothetical protein
MRLNRVRTGSVRLKTKTLMAAAALSVSVLGLSVTAVFPALADGSPQTTVYNNIPNPTPSNVPSYGNEAYSLSELGSQLDLDGSARKNPTVTVLMSSWACKSGSWNAKNCITNPGSTFTHPMTVNVYNVNEDDSVGNLITTKTQTFTMPYRPTADDGTNCNAANGKAGEWWDGSSCYNGKAFKISFDLNNNVTLPDNVIIGVAYNTTHHGYAPIGESASCYATPQGCPYDSLNIGTSGAPTVGSSEPTDQDAYVNSSWGGKDGFYCDSNSDTPGPVGVFRLDSGCWTDQDGVTPVIPAIKVEASGGKSSYPGHPHKPKYHKPYKNHHDKFWGKPGFYSAWYR